MRLTTYRERVDAIGLHPVRHLPLSGVHRILSVVRRVRGSVFHRAVMGWQKKEARGQVSLSGEIDARRLMMSRKAPSDVT